MSEKYCYICLSETHSFNDCIYGGRHPRVSNIFCYICFSKNHSFIDCVYAVPNLFIPNIDQNLFYRFMELLVVEEKLLLMLTYPRIFNSFAIKPIKIMQKDQISLTNLATFMDLDMVYATKALVYQSYIAELKSRIAFRIEHLEIYSPYPHFERLKLSPEELFLLCTFKTKSLKCTNIEFHPKVNLRQIVEAAPILEKIDIYQTNIEVNHTWVDLLRNLQNLNAVSLAIPQLNINIANLAALLEANKNVLRIHLYIINPRGNYGFNQNYAFMQIHTILSSHFVPTPFSSAWASVTVSFKFDTGYAGNFHHQRFELKSSSHQRIA